MRLLVSPWTGTFDTLVRSIEHSALVVSPYVTAEPLRYIAQHLKSPRQIRCRVSAKVRHFRTEDSGR